MVKIWQFILLTLNLFFGTSYQLIAQPSIQRIDSLRVDATEIFTDHLNHVYLLTHDGTLSRRNEKLQPDYVYSKVDFGIPDDVDLTNPLHSLVFYKSFQQIIILDNQLSAIGSLDLAKAGLFDVSAVCYADDNSVWVFDHALRKLVKLNNSGQIEQESIDIGLLGIEVNIIKIVQRNDEVYALDPDKGIFRFDRYASYNNLIPIKHIDDFWIDQDRLILLKNNQLNRLNLLTSVQDIMPFDEINIDFKAIAIEADRLWVLYKGYLLQFQLTW